eukprot:9048158-Pyramimonas_sp.AAC.1
MVARGVRFDQSPPRRHARINRAGACRLLSDRRAGRSARVELSRAARALAELRSDQVGRGWRRACGN